MLTQKKLRHEDALEAVRTGDFPAAVREASPKTAIVLTQSWCPEWKHMKRYLASLETDSALAGEEITVWYLVYDGTDYFDSFRNFKEKVLGNDRIPYVRYYRDGRLAGESNFTGKLDFLRSFG